MTISKENTVGEIVSQNIKAADVFKKHGIDFCCGGGISLEKACSEHGIDFISLSNQLNQVEKAAQRYDYQKWELDFLVDHIINIHHSFVQESIPILLEYSQKAARVHGENHPELIEVYNLIGSVTQELSMHLKKEEMVLFPYIKSLVMAKKNGTTVEKVHFGTVQNPIRMMELEHDNAGGTFKAIRQLSNNFTPPTDACNTYKALYAKLHEFEQDLHLHIHLENNVLHPRAVKLEEELLS